MAEGDIHKIYAKLMELRHEGKQPVLPIELHIDVRKKIWQHFSGAPILYMPIIRGATHHEAPLYRYHGEWMYHYYYKGRTYTQGAL